MSSSPNVFHPSFAHGIGDAASQQILLASCLERRSIEDAEERNAQALQKAWESGRLSVGSMVPQPRSETIADGVVVAESSL